MASMEQANRASVDSLMGCRLSTWFENYGPNKSEHEAISHVSANGRLMRRRRASGPVPITVHQH